MAIGESMFSLIGFKQTPIPILYREKLEIGKLFGNQKIFGIWEDVGVGDFIWEKLK